LSADRLDRLSKGHPQVQDAAVFPIAAGPVGQRIGVAVVPRPGEYPNLTDILLWLADQKSGVLDRPVSLVAVAEIPRGADGRVLRDSLFLEDVA